MELTAQHIARLKLILQDIISVTAQLVQKFVTKTGMELTAQHIARPKMILQDIISVTAQLV
jgi:hypothetical protein